MALSSRLNTARCSRSSSPSTTNSPGSASQSTRTPSGRLSDARPRGARRRAGEAREIDRLGARHAHAREVEELREQATQAIGLAHDERARASARRRPRTGERESCSTALRIDASGFLISCASDADSSATPSSRSARRRSDLHALLIGDVLEDRRRRAVGAQAVAVGVGRRHADRTALPGRRRSSPRRASCASRSRTERSSASRQLGRDAPQPLEHRLPAASPPGRSPSSCSAIGLA